METTLYHRRKDGGVKVWMARLSGDTVTQSWGTHEKKIQTTRHVVKGNDRMSAEERAEHRFNRLVEMRQRKGYVTQLKKIADAVLLEDGALNFDRLPRHFAPAKPIKHRISIPQLLEWDKQGLLSVQRKWDGMRHRIVSGTTGAIRIYSSSNADVTDSLLPLVGNLKMSPRTILDAELVAVNDDASDSFKTVSSVARSLPGRAQRMVTEARGRKVYVKFIAFDLLYESGQQVFKWTYRDRRERLTKILSKSVIEVVQETGTDLQKSMTAVKKLGWEGLVVWRLDQHTVVRTNGSPDRANCWKVKFVKEEDVVATGFKLGKGKNHNVVGKFMISFGGRPMGKCGGGLDDKTREEALSWKYPCVIQIEYDSKTEKGFRFPIFIRRRTDKAVSECR